MALKQLVHKEFLFCFVATPGGVEKLLLSLHLGIIPSRFKMPQINQPPLHVRQTPFLLYYLSGLQQLVYKGF